MRYAVTTAAVFGAAMFLAPTSLSASNSNINDIITTPAVTVRMEQPASAKVRLASAPASTVAAATKTIPVTTPVAEPATVTVASGDNLSKLAAAAGTTYRRLYDANPGVTNPDLIYPGQQLRVPAADEPLPARELPANAPAAAVLEPAQPSRISPRQSAPQPVEAPAVASGSVWDQLAKCESGGNWAINTGNGYFGGLQFTLSTWQSVGGSGYPHQASREEQINRAEILLARSGWGQWPACTSKLGLR